MADSRRRRSVAVLGGIALAAVVAVGASAVAVDEGWVHLNDPPLTMYSVQGLDVSHHQGRIDWSAVARTGRYRFVWIKASEGSDWTDPRFAENRAGAAAAGLDVGAYHYFTQCSPGAAQLAQFVAVVGGDWGRLPPAIDLEHVGNCGVPPPAAQVQAEIRVFVDGLAREVGRKPVIYTTRRFWRTVLGDVADDCPLWLRDVFRRPGGLGGRPWDVWQYLSRGRVDGIDGFVDQNAFHGDAAAYAAFVGP